VICFLHIRCDQLQDFRVRAVGVVEARSVKESNVREADFARYFLDLRRACIVTRQLHID